MKFILTLLAITLILTACSNNSGVSESNLNDDPIGFECPSDFPIKGNATSKTGDLIYHVPSGGYYDKTQPEECFSTESDAEAAGYRKSKR